MVAGMLMPLRELRAIYEVLFRDGVMVAKKDKRPQTKHPELEGVSNLQVIRAMGSLKSRGYVNETFAWRHFYWYLTNEGIVYLRDYLRLPPEIVPATLQRFRKPVTTLAIAQRAARVQSVEGPTSYVPKPGRRGEAESQESLAERQGYRHKMMGPGEKESYSDRTPRFRGRPLAAEPVRPKAPWEPEEQPQPPFRRGNGYRVEAAVMEESRVKRVSRQEPDVSSEKPEATSQERRAAEVQKDKAPMSVQSQRAALKQDVQQTSLTLVSSKTALPKAAAVAQAAGAATSKSPAEPSTPNTNKEKPKITEKASMKSSYMVTSNSAITKLPDTEEAKQEKTKTMIVDPVKTTTITQKSSKLINDTAAPVIIQPANKNVTDEKTKNVIVDPVKSAEVKASTKTAAWSMKTQSETSKLVADTTTAKDVVIKFSQDVKEEKHKRAKVNEEPIKQAEGKTTVESKIDQEKSNTTSKVTVTQETTKPRPDSTTSKPVKEISKVKVTQEPIDAKLNLANQSAKPKTDGLQKTTMVTESSILEVKTTISTTSLSTPVLGSVDAKTIRARAAETEIITKTETINVEVTPHVKKAEKIEEAPKISAQGITLMQNESSSPQLSQNVATMEIVTETKQVVEGSSKSKRKKKKSPAEISKSINAEENPDLKLDKVDKVPVEVAENTVQPTPLKTSEPLTMCTSIKTQGHVEENKTQAKIGSDGGNKQTEDQSISGKASLPLDEIPAVPLVELPDAAQVKRKVEGSSVSKITSFPEDNTELPYEQPVKSGGMTVTKVETMTVHKITEVELVQASPKPEGKNPAAVSKSQKPIVETKAQIITGKAAEETSKSKKKGKGKMQEKAPVTDTINPKPVFLPEEEALLSTTSLPKATVKDSRVMTSETTELSVSPKMIPERMCCEETRQAAAVLCEAPADKGEVEPAQLFAEKIKQEVPKPKTSSTAREAPAARELASAAPALTAEAAVDQAQASPLHQQEEPPKVAQHSASQAAERSTEKRLSVSEALKQEGEKKRDLEEDTPSATGTPATEELHLGDTCESDTDEAAMKRKIVVVEEIVEVKQIISPDATGAQSAPPPVQPEEEGEELDLDVLEAIAIERALLTSPPPSSVGVQGASPEETWDHSLDEPEEKTWPHFIEDLFEYAPINLLPTVPESHWPCDVIALAASVPPFFVVWEVLVRGIDDESFVASPQLTVL